MSKLRQGEPAHLNAAAQAEAANADVAGKSPNLVGSVPVVGPETLNGLVNGHANGHANSDVVASSDKPAIAAQQSS